MRYQRIHTKIWHDEKFASLSPTGQRLFLYFLSSPHSNLLGLYILRPEYACGDLKSLPKDFAKDLAEVLGKGLVEYDEVNSVILLPRYLIYNPLTNPNQLKAAIAIIKEMPQTPLLQRLKVLVEGLPEGLIKGLLEVLTEVLLKPVTVTVAVAVAVNPPTPFEKGEVVPLNSSVEEIINYLNQKTGKPFKPSIPKTHRLISARMREGFGVDDFKKVIDNQCRTWLKDPKMFPFLRPETLFGTKFDGYLNAVKVEKKKREDNKPIIPLASIVQEVMEAKREKYDRKAEDCTNPKKAECQSLYCPSTCRFRGKTEQILAEGAK